MLPPILPSPTSPMSMLPPSDAESYEAEPAPIGGTDASGVSAGQAHRHEQVAVGVARNGLRGVLAGKHRRAGGSGEPQLGVLGAQDAQAVEQVRRVERDRDVVAVEGGVQRLGRLRL